MTLDLNLSAADFWALRLKTGLQEHCARGEQQIYKELEFEQGEDAEGNETIRRVEKLEFQENPVPVRLRGFLKDPDFSFQNRVQWHKALFDEAHPLRFTTVLPVFNERIHIEVHAVVLARARWNVRSDRLSPPPTARVQGGEWAEHVSSTECRLHCWTKVHVKNFGTPLNKFIENQTLKNVLAASKLFPQRVSVSLCPAPGPSLCSRVKSTHHAHVHAGQPVHARLGPDPHRA